MDINIDQLISDWQRKLILAGNPTEREQAKNELARLEQIKAEQQAKPVRNGITITFHPNSTPVVLIIHGHDVEMKRSVQLFVNRAGLQDLVWHEEPDRNRTIIEKLTDESCRPDYVVALLSPDDVLSDGTMRARQNVIFEIGFYLGRLGRDKVRLLLKGNPEIPSDLRGILYDEYDERGAWRMKLAKEIRAAGITINYDRIVDKF